MSRDWPGDAGTAILVSAPWRGLAPATATAAASGWFAGLFAGTPESPGRGPQEPREPARQMCLVGKADLGGNVRERLAREDPVPGSLDSTPDHARMRRDPENGSKGARELSRRHADRGGRRIDRDRLEYPLVEVCPETLGQVRYRAGVHRERSRTE